MFLSRNKKKYQQIFAKKKKNVLIGALISEYYKMLLFGFDLCWIANYDENNKMH